MIFSDILLRFFVNFMVINYEFFNFFLNMFLLFL